MSSEDWFGTVPRRWQSAPLGYSFEVSLGKMLNANKDSGAGRQAPYLAAGSIQPETLLLDDSRRMTFTDDELSQYDLRANDIVVVEGGAGYGRSHLLREDLPGWGFQNHVARLRSRGVADPRFVVYCLKACLASGYIEANNRTATLPSLSRDVLRSLRLPLAPPAKQRAIADYLDSETARIDELIAEQERLLEVLTERRHAFMTSVFGAHVGAGDRLKWHIDETDIRAGERATALPMLSVSISWGVRRRDEISNEQSRAESLSNYKICSQGDLVINRMRAFQGALGLAPEEGVVSPDYAVLKIKPGVNPEWLVGAMRTSAFVSEMARRVKGIGSAELGNARTPRINVSDLGEIRLRIPDRAQQDSEQAEVMCQVARLDRLALEAERLIDLARERRSALITAAVTGQIDVRSGT